MADAGARDQSSGQPDANLPPETNSRETLSRHQRITDGDVFRRAFDKSEPQVGKLMVLRLTQASGARRRLGVIASRRTFSRAVDRARARRLVREAFRRVRSELEGESDVVILTRRRLISAKREAIEAELLALAKRAYRI